MTFVRTSLSCSLLFLSITLIGCGGESADQWTKDRPQVFPVSGTVLMDGEPLEGATVTFRPDDGRQASTGRTDAEGKFQLTTFESNDGAVPGKSTVSISKYEEVVPPAGYNADTSPPLPEPKLLTPAKYMDFQKSGLTAEVSKDGSNGFTFELKSK